ncbi:MAG TPA: hypothetical protein VFS77_14125, partial [Pyrinomonadaceae bacterium]|nr:hypothetical protein [Pyrinomonadaceae bacterium]
WAQLSDELSGKFLGKLLIGWYHSHPRLDVFLSSHDMEIQTERFAEPWNVALVLEPEKHHGGFFCARDGRINPNLPVDFFELLERNSRDSVIAWENYRASATATPVLSMTNTATPTSNTSQELLEVRAKQNERTVGKGKRHGKLFWFAVFVLVLGSAALGVVNRKRIAGWWQQRMAGVSNTGVPAQPSPSAEPSVQPSAQPSAEPSLEPSVAPSPSVEPSPTPEAAAQPTPVAQSTPAAAPTPKRTTRRSTAKPPAPKRRRK